MAKARKQYRESYHDPYYPPSYTPPPQPEQKQEEPVTGFDLTDLGIIALIGAVSIFFYLEKQLQPFQVLAIIGIGAIAIYAKKGISYLQGRHDKVFKITFPNQEEEIKRIKGMLKHHGLQTITFIRSTTEPEHGIESITPSIVHFLFRKEASMDPGNYMYIRVTKRLLFDSKDEGYGYTFDLDFDPTATYDPIAWYGDRKRFDGAPLLWYAERTGLGLGRPAEKKKEQKKEEEASKKDDDDDEESD